MTETQDWQQAGSDPEAAGRPEGVGTPLAETSLDAPSGPVATRPAPDKVLQLSLTRQLAAGLSVALSPPADPAVPSLPGVAPEAAASPGAARGLPDDDLENGIASVFAALYAAGDGAAARSDAAAAAVGEDFEDLAEAGTDDAVTFRLLGELDRLWHQHAA